MIRRSIALAILISIAASHSARGNNNSLHGTISWSDGGVCARFLALPINTLRKPLLPILRRCLAAPTVSGDSIDFNPTASAHSRATEVWT